MTMRTTLANCKEYLDNDLEDVYQFGVYKGRSIREISDTLHRADIPIRKIWGFDSFEGLPREIKDPLNQIGWDPGVFDTREENQSSKEACSMIEKSLSDIHHQVHLIPGYFCFSLNESTKEVLDLRPAKYVDIDVDMYTSTIDVLDFMYSNGLIVEGTFIGYDDWGGTVGWENFLSGESRAHIEMCIKYQVMARPVCQFGNEFPHVQKLFLVDKIGLEQK